MCLFFGDLASQCSHAECQIVSTIRSLNPRSLFQQVASDHRNACRFQNPVSISELIDQTSKLPYFKTEERQLSIEEPLRGEKGKEEQQLRERVDQLEREVKELGYISFWMKEQLEKRGLI